VIVAGFFGAFLFVALVVTDWVHFTSLGVQASRYGCRVARREDHLPYEVATRRLQRFDKDGVLQLSHGIARLFRDECRILLRPQYHLFARRFRTAWPLKATIDLKRDGDGTTVLFIKRMPWSSAVLTVMWFVIVAVGTLGFLVAFAVEGGFASLGGVLMGLGVTGLGLVVLVFGLIIVTLAYRLEDDRLTKAYQELRDVLADGQR
jgi:hypothetical protein